MYSFVSKYFPYGQWWWYTGVISGDIVITYQMIQQDVHNAVHWAHTEVNIK